MAMTRREAFKNLAKGSLPILAVGCASTGLSGVAHAEEEKQAPKEALGLLYDATRCVGCKSCMVACSQANNLPPDTRTDGLHQNPRIRSAWRSRWKRCSPASRRTERRPAT